MKSDSHIRRRAAERRGRRAELIAELVLLAKGFWTMERRFKTKAGEVDLIARRGDLVLMVEVKARASLSEAMDAVTPQAQRRIEAAGDIWLSKRLDHDRLSIRYDLVAVLPRRWPVHVPSIYMA